MGSENEIWVTINWLKVCQNVHINCKIETGLKVVFAINHVQYCMFQASWLLSPRNTFTAHPSSVVEKLRSHFVFPQRSVLVSSRWLLLTVLIKRHFGFLAFPICRLYIKSLTAAPLPPFQCCIPQASPRQLFPVFHFCISTLKRGGNASGVSWGLVGRFGIIEFFTRSVTEVCKCRLINTVNRIRQDPHWNSCDDAHPRSDPKYKQQPLVEAVKSTAKSSKLVWREIWRKK